MVHQDADLKQTDPGGTRRGPASRCENLSTGRRRLQPAEPPSNVFAGSAQSASVLPVISQSLGIFPLSNISLFSFAYCVAPVWFTLILRNV